MAPQVLHMDITSVKGMELEEVMNCFSKNKGVYADVYISGSNTSAKQKTPVDKNGRTNPMMFPINVDDPEAQKTFVVKLEAVGVLRDRVIGKVHEPMAELLKNLKTIGANRKSCSIMTSRGKEKGVLDIRFEFRELIAYAGDVDVVAYPHQPAPASGGGDPPAQPQNSSKFGNVAAGIGAGAAVFNALFGVLATIFSF